MDSLISAATFILCVCGLILIKWLIVVYTEKTWYALYGRLCDAEWDTLGNPFATPDISHAVDVVKVCFQNGERSCDLRHRMVQMLEILKDIQRKGE